MEDAINAMVAPYDPYKNITNLFVQIKKGVKISDAANTPFTNSQIIAKSYIFVQKTGPNSEQWKAWDRCPSEKEICINFCIHLYQAYKDLRNSRISAGQYVLNSANVDM